MKPNYAQFEWQVQELNRCLDELELITTRWLNGTTGANEYIEVLVEILNRRSDING